MKVLKYIVTKKGSVREIIPGYVEFHKDIVDSLEDNDARCVGGGMIGFNGFDNKITLFGESVDYGKVSGKDMDLALKGKRKEFAKHLYKVLKRYEFDITSIVSEDEFANYTIVLSKQ